MQLAIADYRKAIEYKAEIASRFQASYVRTLKTAQTPALINSELPKSLGPAKPTVNYFIH